MPLFLAGFVFFLAALISADVSASDIENEVETVELEVDKDRRDEVVEAEQEDDLEYEVEREDGEEL